MPRKKKKSSRRRSGKGETIGQRVRLYLDELYGGNKSRMADALGCSHTAVANVAAGRQVPRHGFLASLAAQEGVNVEWLITGRGSPLRTDQEDSHSGGWPIRVSDQLLPGPPADHTELLSNESHLVIADLYSPARYFYRVPKGAAIVRDLHEGVRGDDLILVEADPVAIKEGISPGQLCVVCMDVQGTQKEKLVWGHVDATHEDGEPVTFEVSLIEQGIGRSPNAREITLIVDPDYDTRIVDEMPLKRTKPRGKRADPEYEPRYLESWRPLSLENIRGVGVMLVRQT